MRTIGLRERLRKKIDYRLSIAKSTCCPLNDVDRIELGSILKSLNIVSS